MSEFKRALRRWRQAWTIHLALAGMLAAGLALYGVYAGWATRMVSPAQQRAEQLKLPGNMVLLAPEWTGAVTAPSYDVRGLLPQGGYLAQSLRYTVAGLQEAIRTTALGPQGAQSLWGFGPQGATGLWAKGADNLREALPLTGGRWPDGPDEVLWPDNDLPGRPALDAAVILRLPVGFDGRMVVWQPKVVGFYRPDDLVQGPIALEATVAGLTGVKVPNALLVWQLDPALIPANVRSSRWSDSIADRLTATREPSLPGGPKDSPLRGSPLPFAGVTKIQVLTPSTTADQVAADALGRRLVLMPSVMMLMVLLFISVTTVTAALMLGRREEMGIYKTFGVKAATVQREMLLEMMVTAIWGTLVGSGALLAFIRYSPPTLRFSLPWGPMASVWLPAVTIFGLWAGRSAAALYGTAETRALLKKTAQFDWWALIRFDYSKPLE